MSDPINDEERSELSAEVQRLRARLAREKGYVEGAEASHRRAEAENDELRAEVARLRIVARLATDAGDDARAAARDAAKLFERMAREDRSDRVAPETWKSVCEWQARPVVVAAMQTVAGYPRDCSKRGGEHYHLPPDGLCVFCKMPYQPAAPTAVERGKMIERMFDDEREAPARTEPTCPCGWCVKRAEAEQAVLDAWALVPTSALRRALDANMPGDDSLPAVRAELARRGLTA